ncbi:MAG: hypothetical protein IJS12_10430 [Lachnospiraceae bacterium]|nr:hypothetical protein [Lachnospiraceae bacterium]
MIEKRSRIGEIIYIIYFTVMMAARAIGMYEGMKTYSIVFVFAMLLFVCKMIVTPHTWKEYTVAVVLMGVAVIVYRHTGEAGLIVCFATLLGMKGVDHIKALSCGALVAAVCIFGRIVTGVFGLMPERYWPQIRSGAGLMFRHALGYAHPNTLHMNVLMLSMLVIYLVTYLVTHRRSIESTGGSVSEIETSNLYGLLYLVIASSVVFLFNLYVFRYSGSRTGLLATTAYLIVNLWFYIRRTPGLFERIVCYVSFPFVCFLAIVLPHIVPDSIFEFVDRTLFTTRYTIARYFWSHNRMSLWGIRLANPDPEYRTYGIDMAQLYLFLQLGLIAFAVISVITMVYIHRELKAAHMAELAVLMGVLFAGIWEPFLYNLGFKNFVYVFMGMALYRMMAEWQTARVGSTDEAQTRAVGCRGDQTVTDDSDTTEKPQPDVYTKAGVTKFLLSLVLGAVVGCIASSAYVLATDPPHALYADREQDEAGESFGMEPLYLTEDEAAGLRSSGELIVGYQDVNTPMYMYDESIAIMEYHKRVLSVGVWCGMIFECGLVIIYLRRFLFCRK